MSINRFATHNRPVGFREPNCVFLRGWDEVTSNRVDQIGYIFSSFLGCLIVEAIPWSKGRPAVVKAAH